MGRNPEWGIAKKAEETGFEVLITMDSNMTFQLNSITVTVPFSM